MKTETTVNHIYKHSTERGGMLYAWFASMHTRVDLILCGSEGEEPLCQTAEEVRATLARLENVANCYDPLSELSRLNSTAFHVVQPVSEDLWPMLHFCLTCYDRTAGCFDVTVSSDGYLPGHTIRQVALDSQGRTLSFCNPGVRINLCGFLKGYALDCIRPLLHSRGITDALVSLGNSSVMALGNAPGSGGWSVDFVRGRRPDSAVTLHDECLTTSGNDSPQRLHIRNPHTAQWVQGERQVAVVTPDGSSGEVLSTGLFVADAAQREFMIREFAPRLVIDL